MKSFFFFITTILLVLCTSVNAQNYQPFYKEDKVHYTYSLGASPILSGNVDFTNKVFYEVCNVDSIKIVNTDSVFYLNHSYPKGFVYEGNFLGTKVLKRSNGDISFTDDTNIRTLKMNSTPGDSWKHLSHITWEDSLTITYKGKAYYPVYDTYDSVMVFEIQNSEYIDSIVLSKSYGITHAFALFSIEHLTYDQSYNYKNGKGENKFNFLEYFDYTIGDLISYNKFDHAYSAYITERIYLHILSRQESQNGDTVEYDVSICKKAINSNPIWHSGKIVVTEFKVVDFADLFWLPINPDLLKVPFSSQFECMMDTLGGYIEFDNVSHFYIYETYMINQYSVEFKKGIGFTNSLYIGSIFTNGSTALTSYGARSNYIPNGNESSLLEVYEQLLNNSDGIHESFLSLFPNPAKEEIFIDLSERKGKSIIITILNSIGEKVYESNIDSSIDEYIKINLSALSSGYHLIRIEDTNNRNNNICKSFLKL